MKRTYSAKSALLVLFALSVTYLPGLAVALTNNLNLASCLFLGWLLSIAFEDILGKLERRHMLDEVVTEAYKLKTPSKQPEQEDNLKAS